jgi:hypothetical protein
MKEVRPTGLLPDTTIWKLVDLLTDPSASDSKEFNMVKREAPATYRYCHIVIVIAIVMHHQFDCC